MKINNKKFFAAMAAALLLGAVDGSAQEFNVAYTTEIQSDFKDQNNWLNQLRLDFGMDITKGLRFEASSFSVAKSNSDIAFGDYQTFSNIDADGMVLALAKLGLNWAIGSSELFVGVHNMDENFFGQEHKSLFMNSSCGMIPTIAGNFGLATYPEAAMGIAYTLRLKEWTFQTSLYNGVGSTKFNGRNNVFRVCPDSDGFLSATQLSYEKNGSGYYLGMAHHNGYHGDAAEKTTQSIFWAIAEQQITNQLTLIGQYSFNSSANRDCRSFGGGGVTMAVGESEGGAFVNYVDMNGTNELAAELTWKFPVFNNAYLQPALHYFTNSDKDDIVGVLRFGYEL